jgi:xanthosine utilization system XapX-like protein
MNKLEKDAIQTDSKISAMRIAFLWMIKYIIILSSIVAIAAIIFALLGKPFPLGAFIGLIGVLGTIAFGGKAAQSFGENQYSQSWGGYNTQPFMSTTTTTMPAVSQINPRVSGTAEEPPQQ